MNTVTYFLQLLSCTLIKWLSAIPIPRLIREPIYILFSKALGISIDETLGQLSDFKTMDAFFTRPIKPELRPISLSETSLISPVDGTISQFSMFPTPEPLGVKGYPLDCEKLIPFPLNKRFTQGSACVVYLSPKDCHRVFSPINGRIISHCHIAGTHYPVRPPYPDRIPGLYIKNERVAIVIDSDYGLIALVMVAALNVGNISLEYFPEFRSDIKRSKSWGSCTKTVSYHTLTDKVFVSKGERLGTFHLGSTVILLTEKKVSFNKASIGKPINYGQRIADF
ncbi:archaetidylserine decarboxylase [Thermoproteota archaeon]